MMKAKETTTVTPTNRGLPWLGWAVLLLTAVMAGIWSANKVLNQDEIFSLQTDRVPTLSEVLHIQREYPISLEAPPYHVLSHAAITVLGPTPFALRLPSLLGFLLLQVCLYFFVRNLAGERAGLIAMAIPGLSFVLLYAAEGRPYGLLMGACALTVLCWQVAARRGEAGDPRALPLAGLAFALALTLTVHFYGVLVLIPLCGAELVRSWTRRTLDKSMFAAILLGMASLATTLPYIKASSEFKKHYYAAVISPHMIAQPYRQMLIDYTKYSQATQRMLALLLVIVAIAVAWGCVRALRCRSVRISAGEGALLFLLAILPLFAFVLGRLVTHALEPRHSFAAIVAVASLIAIGISSLVRSSRVFYAVMAVMLLGIVLVNTARAREYGAEGRAMLETLKLTPEQSNAIASLPDRNIYFQDLGAWEFASQYTQDPALKSRLVLAYSLDEEMRRRQHDTMYLTAIHTMKFSAQPIVSYDALRQSPGPHIFATFHSGWSWTDDAFREEASEVTPMGKAFAGDLVQVRWR